MSGSISATTLTYLSLAATAVSTVAGVVGEMQQSKAQAQAANYNASVAAANAEIAKQKTAMAGAAATAQAEQASLKTRAQVGGILAQQGAAGIDVNSGSAFDVRSSAKELGQLNALSVRSNATRAAYGYQIEGMNDTAQSNLDKSQANNAESAGGINAAGTVLGGIGDATTKYSKFQLEGGNSLNSSGIYSDFDNAGTSNINWN